MQYCHSNSRPECLRRLGITATVMQRLERVCSQQHLSLTTKLRIYSTCILPVLLYGSESWTLLQSEWDKLESFHIRCQRRILHINWYDFVSNAEVLSRTGLARVATIIKRRLDSVPMVSYYVLYSNCVCKMRRFGDTRLLKLP